MGWSEVQEAVRSAIALALELPDFVGGDGTTMVPRVEWEHRAKASRWEDGPWCDLALGSVSTKGHDETRMLYTPGSDPATSVLVPAVCGYRLFTVAVKIGSFSQEPGAESVGELGSRLRTRLRRRDVLALLDGASSALVRIGPTMNADYENADGRLVSYSATEVRFSTVEIDFHADEDAGFVDDIAADGTLTTPAGTQLLFDFDSVH